MAASKHTIPGILWRHTTEEGLGKWEQGFNSCLLTFLTENHL